MTEPDERPPDQPGWGAAAPPPRAAAPEGDTPWRVSSQLPPRKALDGRGRKLALALAVFAVLSVLVYLVSNYMDTHSAHPSARDVRITSCSDGTVVHIAVTNHTSKTSDYLMTLLVNDDAGVTIGQDEPSIDAVKPGETRHVGVHPGPYNVRNPLTWPPLNDNVSCHIEDVQRTATLS